MDSINFKFSIISQESIKFTSYAQLRHTVFIQCTCFNKNNVKFVALFVSLVDGYTLPRCCLKLNWMYSEKFFLGVLCLFMMIT